jgi:DNA phosphorothioation-dependent restriction protein DptG
MAAAASKPGEECYKKLWDMAKTLKDKVKEAELDKCCDALKKSAEKELMACFATQKPSKPYP